MDTCSTDALPAMPADLWQHNPMITAGTSSPAISFDHGEDEPGMILQREYREGGNRVWRDYLVE